MLPVGGLLLLTATIRQNIDATTWTWRHAQTQLAGMGQAQMLQIDGSILSNLSKMSKTGVEH